MQRKVSNNNIRSGEMSLYADSFSKTRDINTSLNSMDNGHKGILISNAVEGVVNQFSLVRYNHQDDKKELATLNNKFAQYIEKLKLLELRNRRLQNIRKSVLAAIESSGNKMAQFYISETSSVGQANETTTQSIPKCRMEADSNKEKKETALVQYSKAKKSYDDTRLFLKKLYIDSLQKKNEVVILQRRIADIDEEVARCGAQKGELLQRIESLRIREGEERLRISIAQENKESLMAEISLLNQSHECEVEEYIQAMFDNWKNEKLHLMNNDLSQAILNARKEYEDSVDNTRQQLLKKYEQMMSLSRRKPNLSVSMQEQSMGQSIDKVKKVKRCLQGEIDNCRATLCFLRTKQGDLIKAIAAENTECEKSAELHRNDKKTLEVRIKEAEGILRDSINTHNNARKEIEEYRNLLEGDETVSGLRSIVNSFAS